jgi:hypothetical protein
MSLCRRIHCLLQGNVTIVAESAGVVPDLVGPKSSADNVSFQMRDCIKKQCSHSAAEVGMLEMPIGSKGPDHQAVVLTSCRKEISHKI